MTRLMPRLISRVVLLSALALGLAGAMPHEAHAVTLRAGGDVEIPAGTVIADDLYVAGGDVRIRGRVDGDLVVMGGNVTVSGDVRDDLIVAGGKVNVPGAVGQSIRAAGGTITVAGPVGRDLLLAGNQLTQLAGSQASGSAVLTGRAIAMHGTTVGALRAKGDTVLIDGRVGSADVTADDLTVTAGARIDGPLRYSGAREADLRPGATIAGPVTREGEGPTWTWHVPSYVGWLLLFMVSALPGVLLALLMPGVLAATARELRRSPGLALASGAGILFGVPLLAVLLTLTLIGIPLALSLLVFYALGLYFAWVLGAIALGDTILQAVPIRSPRLKLVLAALLGLFVLLLLTSLPWVGGLVAALALMAGFGAPVVTLGYRLARGA